MRERGRTREVDDQLLGFAVVANPVRFGAVFEHYTLRREAALFADGNVVVIRGRAEETVKKISALRPGSFGV